MAKVKRASLADLYVVGKEVVIDDGTHEAVTLWLQKLNQFEHEKAFRAANAARAAINMNLARDGVDAPEFTHLFTEYEEVVAERNAIVLFLTQDELNGQRPALEAEVASRDEWSNEDYLQGLSDRLVEIALADEEYAASEDGDVAAQEARDEERAKIRSEITRYNDQVQEEVDNVTSGIQAGFEALTDEVLHDKIMRKVIKIYADMTWLNEYRKQQIRWAVRWGDDHSDFVFNNVDDLNKMTAEVINTLINEYEAISIDVVEGKS